MGIALVIGLTEYWIVSIGIVTLVLFYRQEKHLTHIRTNKTVIALVLLLAINSLYSPNPVKGLIYAISIYICAVILNANPSRREILYSIYVLSGVNLVWGGLEYLTGVQRIFGAHQNASALGLSALATLPALPGFTVIGFSLSRTALAGALLFAILRNHKTVWLGLVVAIVVHVSIAYVVFPERLGIYNASRSINARVELVTNANVNIIADANNSIDRQVPKSDESLRHWKLFGYGHHGYLLSTGLVQPHNVYVLSWWELGILSIPFWILVCALWFKVRNYYLLILLPLALLVDEWFTDIEGVYAVALMHYMTRGLSAPVDNWRGFARIRNRLHGV